MREYVLAVSTVVGAVIYLALGLQLQTVIGDPLGPRVFPAIIGGGLLLSAALIYAEARAKRRLGAAPAAEQSGVQEIARDARGKHRARRILCGMAMWTLAYDLAFEPLGYPLATFIYVLAMLAYFHAGRWLANLVIAAGFTLCAYLIFAQFLGIALPRGIT